MAKFLFWDTIDLEGREYGWIVKFLVVEEV